MVFPGLPSRRRNQPVKGIKKSTDRNSSGSVLYFRISQQIQLHGIFFKYFIKFSVGIMMVSYGQDLPKIHAQHAHK